MALGVADSVVAALCCVLCGAVESSADCTAVFPLCVSDNTLWRRRPAAPALSGLVGLVAAVSQHVALPASVPFGFSW